MSLLTAVDLTAARKQALASTRWSKLQSVDSTAALSDNSLTGAVDATSCSLQTYEMQAVLQTDAAQARSLSHKARTPPLLISARQKTTEISNHVLWTWY